MIITHQYVRDKFYEYNELMFEGKFFGKLSINDRMSCVLISEDALMKYINDEQYETSICEED